MEENKPSRAEPTETGLGNEIGSTRAMDEALQSSFTILKLIIAVLVVYLVFSNTSAVEGESEGVIILRFGQPRVDSTTNEVWKSGVRFALPYPLEERVRIAREQPLETEFFKYAPVGRLSLGENLNHRPVDAEQDGYVRTRDNQILHITATLRYSITEPSRYVFEFADPEAVLKMALEGAITHVAAENKLDFIRNNRVAFAGQVRKRVDVLARKYGLGVSINGVIVGNDDVELPFMTRKARVQLSQSKDEASRIVADAQKNAQKIRQAFEDSTNSTNAVGEVNTNATEVATIINQAHSEARARVARVEALRDQFDSIYGGTDGKPVRLAEDRRRALERHYYRVIDRMMTESDIKVYYVSGRPGEPRQKVHLLINPKPPKPKKSAMDEYLSSGSAGQSGSPPGP